MAAESTVSGIEVTPAGTRFLLSALGDERAIVTPLVGRHQAANFAFALALLDAAGPPFRVTLAEAADSVHARATSGAIPARGADHLRRGAQRGRRPYARVEPRRREGGSRPSRAVVCVLGDKDWRGMIDELARVVDAFILTNAPTAPQSRAWSLAEVAAYASERGYKVEVVEDFGSAVDRALRHRGNGAHHGLVPHGGRRHGAVGGDSVRPANFRGCSRAPSPVFATSIRRSLPSARSS